MNPNFLDFEQPIADLEAKIQDLRKASTGQSVNIDTEVAGLHGDALKIRVAAAALEDRANDALVEFIAKRLGIGRRGVTLVSGAKSREKRFVIAGAAVEPERLFKDG